MYVPPAKRNVSGKPFSNKLLDSARISTAFDPLMGEVMVE
jgi:hypothetical protein